MALISNGEVVSDRFARVAAGEPLPPTDPVLVHLEDFQASRDELLQRGSRIELTGEVRYVRTNFINGIKAMPVQLPAPA